MPIYKIFLSPVNILRVAPFPGQSTHALWPRPWGVSRPSTALYYQVGIPYPQDAPGKTRCRVPAYTKY